MMIVVRDKETTPVSQISGKTNSSNKNGHPQNAPNIAGNRPSYSDGSSKPEGISLAGHQDGIRTMGRVALNYGQKFK